MRIIRTSDFERSFLDLPFDIQRLYTKQQKIFQDNWRDPRLHIKKVRGLSGAFSFRLTRRYRVLFYFQSHKVAVFFEVDHRKDVYG